MDKKLCIFEINIKSRVEWYLMIHLEKHFFFDFSRVVDFAGFFS